MSFDLKQDVLNAVIQSELLKKNCNLSCKCGRKCRTKVRNRKSKKNPYPKYSYCTGLTNEKGENVWGVDTKWFIWEIKNGNGLPDIF